MPVASHEAGSGRASTRRSSISLWEALGESEGPVTASPPTADQPGEDADPLGEGDSSADASESGAQPVAASARAAAPTAQRARYTLLGTMLIAW
ncbi:hypothetical protein GCM10023224_51250 [Streptomonospora halophila]|uniref:Uncharacterized protein n=1 Tax=Streptomonospora halophila TaxID=427369 RepID=A0ABP9H252_9ACTN